MKVKCILLYHDKDLKKDVQVGEEYEVSEERANLLINSKVAEPLTTEVVTETAPKKKATKKAKEA